MAINSYNLIAGNLLSETEANETCKAALKNVKEFDE